MGKILRAHGIRGEVVIVRFGDSPGLLEPGSRLRLRVGQGGELDAVVASARPVKGTWVVALEGVETRNDAEALAGAVLVTDRAALPALEAGRYYEFEIVGLAVVSEEGETLGTVREILDAGANDVYVIDGPRGEWLLPAGPMVRNIDLAAGRLVVHVLPGLLPEENA